MFGILENLAKAAVTVVVETPVSLVKDLATLGGAITDQPQPYTMTSLEKAADHIEKATQ